MNTQVPIHVMLKRATSLHMVVSQYRDVMNKNRDLLPTLPSPALPVSKRQWETLIREVRLELRQLAMLDHMVDSIVQ